MRELIYLKTDDLTNQRGDINVVLIFNVKKMQGEYYRLFYHIIERGCISNT